MTWALPILRVRVWKYWKHWPSWRSIISYVWCFFRPPVLTLWSEGSTTSFPILAKMVAHEIQVLCPPQTWLGAVVKEELKRGLFVLLVGTLTSPLVNRSKVNRSPTQVAGRDRPLAHYCGLTKKSLWRHVRHHLAYRIETLWAPCGVSYNVECLHKAMFLNPTLCKWGIPATCVPKLCHKKRSPLERTGYTGQRVTNTYYVVPISGCPREESDFFIRFLT